MQHVRLTELRSRKLICSAWFTGSFPSFLAHEAPTIQRELFGGRT